MENKPTTRCIALPLQVWFVLFSVVKFAAGAGDAEALLALKSAIDPFHSLPWRDGAVPEICSGAWVGVKQCTPEGKVSKLVLEFLNLTGELKAELLAPLTQLRVLSFKSNKLYGSVPDLSPLSNLKTLYLSDNRFSGSIPGSLAALHRLKVIVLSNNQISGDIPSSLTSLPRLYTLFLQNNRLAGEIPSFNQLTLRYFNVSNNNLRGRVPATRALSQFNLSSFLGNPFLCGGVTGKPCNTETSISPSPSVSPEPSDVLSLTPPFPPGSAKKNNNRKKRLIAIIAGSAGGFIFISILILLLALILKRKRRRPGGERGIVTAGTRTGKEIGEAEESRGGGGGRGEKGGGAFSWEGDQEQGRLVFVGGAGEMYGMEELLRASAETLGRGTIGSTYKAVMESGYIVTVKRLRDSARPGSAEQFRRRAEQLGALRHPNIVPLRAYFQAKEERLLVYDYFPNGSLFSLIHGSRPSGNGKPLHWTSCLKIAEDVATGLLYLHQSSSETTIHGNLKSSNVLLGPDFESCLTDYGLLPFFRPSPDDESQTPASSLFYRAPETRPPRRNFTPQSDIYSFGVLLLELLTGKTPFQDLVEGHGAEIPSWVKAVREEEAGDQSSDERNNSNEGEEKLTALLAVAMACLATAPESRPVIKEVLRMIREARAEAMVSSNSSDHSPGRWSDTVQSLPREYGSEHLNFAERD